MPAARVVILLSGAGSTAAALLDRFGSPDDATAVVVAVGSDRPQAPGLALAAAKGVGTFVVDPTLLPERSTWDEALRHAIAVYAPDLVVCAGFMRLLGPAVLQAFPQRVVNTHPALLPAFPGMHAVRDALAYGVRVTGATVHLVDAGIDTGPVLAQVPVEVEPEDDENSLHERIKIVERRALVEVVGRLARAPYRVEGRKVCW